MQYDTATHSGSGSGSITYIIDLVCMYVYVCECCVRIRGLLHWYHGNLSTLI